MNENIREIVFAICCYKCGKPFADGELVHHDIRNQLIYHPDCKEGDEN